MIRLLSLPMIVTCCISLLMSAVFLALYRRLKVQPDTEVRYYLEFAWLALVTAIFLGAFAIVVNSSSNLTVLSVSNRVAIVAATFNILVGVQFFTTFLDYRPPIRFAWLYVTGSAFAALAIWPNRFFLENEFLRTSRYYTGLAYGSGFRIWAAWIIVVSFYTLGVLWAAYRRAARGLARHSKSTASMRKSRSTAVALLVASAVWLVTGVSDDLTAIRVIDFPPLTWLGSFLVTGCSAWILVLEINDLYEERRRLGAKLMFDHLTGAHSRGVFDMRLAEAIEGMRRKKLSGLSVCLFDVDDFKGINDGFGHAVGDEVLRAIAAAAKSAVRITDCAARLGGDEFVLLLTDVTEAEVATSVVERLRSKVAHLSVDCDDQVVDVSCSFGLVCVGLDYAWDAELAPTLLKCADAALYDSKRAGKNRITARRMPPPTGPDLKTSRRLRIRSL